VNNCTVCLQAKPDRVSYPGLLSPLPVPAHSWQVVSMDFIDGLPTSGSANCLMVVVDKFSKYAHFVPLHHPYTATKVAQVFLDNVYKLHGMPTHIISDRDPVFTSTFWRELFRLANVQLCLSSAYHPQSDGQTERVNQCLETFLRCFVHSCPRRWLRRVSLAEYWYNTSLHSALGKSPFEVLYGHSPKHFGISDEVVSPVQDVATLMNERETMLRSVRQHLLRAQQRMKHQADKRRSKRSFNIGDQVFLRLQPYVQSSLVPRSYHKLCFKYFEPFKIIDKIGSIAYKLALPPPSTIIRCSMCRCSKLLLHSLLRFPLSFLTLRMHFKFLRRSSSLGSTTVTPQQCLSYSSSGATCLKTSLPGKILKPSSNAFLLPRLGDKPVPKEGGCQHPTCWKPKCSYKAQKKQTPQPKIGRPRVVMQGLPPSEEWLRDK
jgi:hypothetical protein